jgi:hypothetical protein
MRLLVVIAGQARHLRGRMFAGPAGHCADSITDWVRSRYASRAGPVNWGERSGKTGSRCGQREGALIRRHRDASISASAASQCPYESRHSWSMVTLANVVPRVIESRFRHVGEVNVTLPPCLRRGRQDASAVPHR